MTDTLFATQLVLAPEVYRLVPWDAQLLGTGYMSGHPILVWRSKEGVGSTVPRETATFYMFTVGSEIPEDAGEYVGQVQMEVPIKEFKNGRSVQGSESIDVFIFRKDEPKART